MTKRILPKADIYASCPNDGKVLEYYRPHFESVYILFHPFLRLDSIGIESFYGDNWPTKNEIINNCSPISWQDAIELTPLQTQAEIDIGLRTSIGGVKKSLANETAAFELEELTEKREIIHPSEGEIPPLLENRIHESIKSLGYDWLWVGDEFGTERKLRWIDDLIKGDELSKPSCIFTPDNRLLVTTHWDSHCSFLCSSKKNIEKILEFDQFEGFYCTENTEVYWGAHNF